MIHYHGTPITPDAVAVEILKGRHAIVSFANPCQVSLVAEVCHSFILDNGAFSFWKSGKQVELSSYYNFVSDWNNHPNFDWALIPDIIEGTEEENDQLILEWPFSKYIGVPVWHLHESLDRLYTLACNWPRISLGSSAEYSKTGTNIWWERMSQVMSILCIDGHPITKIHGLRMLDTKIFSRLPLSSADSTNVARNINLDNRWKGTYKPPTKAARGIVLASRIEVCQSSPKWEYENEKVS